MCWIIKDGEGELVNSKREDMQKDCLKNLNFRDAKSIFLGRGCIDQIFVLKQLVEKYREKMKELHFVFMDLEKAYDNVFREALWRALHEC